jgi:PilZ domain
LSIGDPWFNLNWFNLNTQKVSQSGRKCFMSSPKSNAGATDWTGLLADPDLARNLGRLLQIYRDAAPEKREQALLAAMREIKQASREPAATCQIRPASQPTMPAAASATPPFEPDLFSSNWAQDRRRHPRIKCFVAVELRVNGEGAPIWGNLSNTGLGGCQVETAAQISGGSKVEIGLWVASGKIWVKGLALNGVVTRSAPAAGVRIRFGGMDAVEKENLRQFLKYVQETARASTSESSYLQLLK